MIDCQFKKKLITPFGNADLDIAFNLNKGQIMGLYGPSGAGKTTLMRCLAGLDAPDNGRIILNEVTCWDKMKSINLPPQQREIGFVFQDYGLFPNMTVRQNLEFAQGDKGESSSVDDIIEVMSLGELSAQYPRLLSGGQKQRVALARSIVQRPSILLLDEPLAAIGSALRMRLQDYILDFRKATGCTVIIASHSVQEMYKLCDHVLKLENGKICESGNPKDVFVNRAVSGKFQFVGTILEIVPGDVLFIASILVGRNLIQIVLDPAEANQYKIGEEVVVASKAFDPIIRKMK